MVRNLSFSLALVALTLLFGGSVAFGRAGTPTNQPEKTETGTQSTHRALSDATFAKIAAEKGLAEVKLGQLAEDKGATQAVKDFGKRMVTDHSNADNALKTAVSRDKIALPAQLSAKDQAVYDRLSKLSGETFDRAYARDMVRDHTADVAVFRQEAKDGKDASIKTFASQTLPTLEDHLKQAHEMLNTISTTNRNQTRKQQS